VFGERKALGYTTTNSWILIPPFGRHGAFRELVKGSFVGWLHLEHRHCRLSSVRCAGAPRQSYHGEHYQKCFHDLPPAWISQVLNGE
jgi:hypothetical protein